MREKFLIDVTNKGVYYNVKAKITDMKKKERKNKHRIIKYSDNSDLIFKNYDDKIINKIETGKKYYFDNNIDTTKIEEDFLLERIYKYIRLNNLSNILMYTVIFIPISLLIKLFIAFSNITLEYRFDEDNDKRYKYIRSLLNECLLSKGKWQIHSKTQVLNNKYNGDFDEIFSRSNITITSKLPYYIKTNVNIYSIKSKGYTIYFMPERIVFIYKNGFYLTKSYNQVQFTLEYNRYIERSKLPIDAEVLYNTWTYLNFDGTRDQRFVNNPQLPVCNYSYVGLKSNDGLNLLFQFSNKKLLSMKRIFDDISNLTQCQSFKISYTNNVLSIDDNISSEIYNKNYHLLSCHNKNNDLLQDRNYESKIKRNSKFHSVLKKILNLILTVICYFFVLTFIILCIDSFIKHLYIKSCLSFLAVILFLPTNLFPSIKSCKTKYIIFIILRIILFYTALCIQ